MKAAWLAHVSLTFLICKLRDLDSVISEVVPPLKVKRLGLSDL